MTWINECKWCHHLQDPLNRFPQSADVFFFFDKLWTTSWTRASKLVEHTMDSFWPNCDWMMQKKKLYRVTKFFFIYSRICFTKVSPFCSNLLEMPFQCPKFRLRIRAEFQNTKFLPQNSKNGTQKRENSFI